MCAQGSSYITAMLIYSISHCTECVHWSVSLHDVNFDQFNWNVLIINSIISTDPHFHVISGHLRKLFAEPWWIVEGTTGTTGSTTLAIPEAVTIRIEVPI